LALAAGFTADDAAKIAIATAGMDHDAATRPGDGPAEKLAQVVLGRTQEYHFPSQEKALARVQGDIDRGAPDLEHFGRHLHSLEDVGFQDAPGPHARSDVHGITATFGIVGLDLMSGGLVTALMGHSVGASIVGGALIALGALIFAF